jgi:hypothetical protein
MLDLKATYGKRYRIALDESYDAEKYDGKSQDIAWYYEIIGKYGQIYPHSATHLQMWLASTKLGARLSRSLPPDWTGIQNTSEGYSFVFPAKDISTAFRWVKPRKRRQGTSDPARLQKLREWGARYHFKKTNQGGINQ